MATIFDRIAALKTTSAARALMIHQLDDRVAALEADHNNPAPVLNPLTLASASVVENTAAGVVISGILGKTSGSTLSLEDDSGSRFAISGTNLVAGLTNIDYEAAPSRNIILKETLLGATNSPRYTTLSVGVVNVFEQPALRALLLSAASFTVGTAANGAITQATAGSIISAVDLPSGFTINGPARTWAYNGTGAAVTKNIKLTETLGDSPNSPRDTVIAVTIAAPTAGVTEVSARPAPAAPPQNAPFAGHNNAVVASTNPKLTGFYPSNGYFFTLFNPSAVGGNPKTGPRLQFFSNNGSTMGFVAFDKLGGGEVLEDGKRLNAIAYGKALPDMGDMVMSAGVFGNFIYLEVDGKIFKTIDFVTNPDLYKVPTKDSSGADIQRTLASLIAELRADTTQRGAGTYSDYGSLAPTEVRTGPYVPPYPPLSVVSSAITVDGKARIVVDYYSAQDSIDIAATSSDGNLAVAHSTVVENSVPGRATIESAKLPSRMRGGAPVTLTLTLAASPAVPAVTTVASWAGPMLFTVNVTQPGDWYANQPLANHIAMDDARVGKFSGTGVRHPHDADPQINYKGDLIEGKITNAAWFIVPPRIPGQRMRLKWKGTATSAFTSNGDSGARNPTPGTDGTYNWVDFNFDWDITKFVRDGRKDAQFIWLEMTPTGTGATWMTELDCRPINADGTPVSTGFWDKPYLDELKATMGHQDYDIARFMDCQRTVHISGLIIERVSQPGDRTARTGVSVDDILAFCEYVGCDARINLPMQATEANVRAEARKVAKWCKRTGRRGVVEWANEIWNSGQGAWQAAVVLGKAMGMTTTGHDNDIANRYHSFGQVQRMGWVREEFVAEGVANLLVRVVCVQNSNEGNQRTICENATGAIDAWDRLETAPYIAGGAATRAPRLDVSGSWDNEEYLTRARASYRSEHAHAKYHRDYARSKGKAFGTYEGGQEDAGDNGFHKQFQISEFARTLAAEQLADWQATVGGAYRWYADNRVDKYGLRVHGGQPRFTTNGVPGAPIWDEWLKAIDAVKAAT